MTNQRGSTRGIRSKTSTSVPLPTNTNNSSVANPYNPQATPLEPSSNSQNKGTWDLSNLLQIGSIIISGVVGYFVSMQSTKEEISNLKINLQKVQTENESLRRDVDSLTNNRASENLNARVSALEATIKTKEK